MRDGVRDGVGRSRAGRGGTGRGGGFWWGHVVLKGNGKGSVVDNTCVKDRLQTTDCL